MIFNNFELLLKVAYKTKNSRISIILREQAFEFQLKWISHKVFNYNGESRFTMTLKKWNVQGRVDIWTDPLHHRLNIDNWICVQED